MRYAIDEMTEGENVIQEALNFEPKPVDPELQELYDDYRLNLLPLLGRYALTYTQRGDDKSLRAMHKNAVSAIQRYQPAPEMEYEV